MTQLELVDGMVRGSGFLTQLARRPVTVLGSANARSLARRALAMLPKVN